MDLLRVISIVEGTSVTGPIKPLLMFARNARVATSELPAVQLSLMTTARVSDAQEKPQNDLTRAAESQGVQIDVVPERHPFDMHVVRRMKELLRTHRPDIVETHNFKCHFLLRIARAGLEPDVRFKWIAFHHGYTRTSLRVSLYQNFDRWSLRAPDRIVTVCKPFADVLAARGAARERIHVLSNAIEDHDPPAAEEIERLRSTLGIRKDDRVLVAIGRLSAEKGQHYLLQAVARLSAERSADRIKLILVGDGPDRDSLTAAARRLGVDATFTGHQSNPWPYFFLADVFVLPSLSEGSPLVLFEAMQAARPIVATSVGGVPETVTHGEEALLTPPADDAALAAAITRLLSDASLAARLGSNAHAAVKRFSPAQYRQALQEIYARVLSDRPRAG